MISLYIIRNKNGGETKIGCNSKGQPLCSTRATPRRFETENEVDTEKKYIDKMKDLNFNVDQSIANLWLTSIFPESPLKHNTITSVAKVFSLLLKRIFPREAYRRRKSCIFWLEENIADIMALCSENKISIIYGNNRLSIDPPNFCLQNNYRKVSNVMNFTSPPPQYNSGLMFKEDNARKPHVILPSIDNLIAAHWKDASFPILNTGLKNVFC